jgi:hypothetical protein
MFDTLGPSFKAGGNVSPSTFVKGDSADFSVVAAGANDAILGISGEGLEGPPGVSGTSAYHASSGNPCKVYGLGSICRLLLGGTVTRFTYIKSDASGAGVAAATSGTTYQKIGAIALESGASGEYIRVQVVALPPIVPALS